MKMRVVIDLREEPVLTFEVKRHRSVGSLTEHNDSKIRQFGDVTIYRGPDKESGADSIMLVMSRGQLEALLLVMIKEIEVDTWTPSS